MNYNVLKFVKYMRSDEILNDEFKLHSVLESLTAWLVLL